jgi:chaperone BCS1
MLTLIDIDCAGAEVGQRHRKPSKESTELDEETDDQVTMDEAVEAIKQTMETFIHRQEQHNETMLQLTTQTAQRIGQQFRAPQVPAPPPPPKEVTLSGLLNAIDGATATEGRLLIMATNHPGNLDSVLLRKGCADEHFEIGYATKVTAELTFNHIFGQDTCKKHKIEAINRFATAFKEQFLTHSKISTATLAEYCAHYRGRPLVAVRMFATYLRLGDAMFDFKIDELEDVPNSSINGPEAYNEELLEVKAEDFCQPDAVPKDAAEKQVSSALSLWRPSTWIGTSKVKVKVKIDKGQLPPARLLIKEAGESVDSPDITSKADQLRTPIDVSNLPLNPGRHRSQHNLPPSAS